MQQNKPTLLVRKLWFLFPLIGLALFLSGCPGPADAIDLTVTNVEVTQAIQTPTNTIPLAAQRRTAVRATLGVSGGASPAGVTGRLHVFVGGAEIGDPAGIAPLATITVPAAPDRANETHTLNFELPTPSGIGASTDVDFRVDVTPVPGESNTGNNSGSANNLTFSARTNPIIFFTKINYSPSGLGLPPDAFIQPGTGDAFVRGIFPVNESDPTLYQPGPFPSLPYSEDADGNGKLDVFVDGNNLLSLLASCRQFIINGSAGPADRVFLYGWIAGPVDGNGLSTLNGRNAFGNAEPNRGQRTMAHEFGHLYGLDHNTRNLDQVGWDVGGRLPGNPATNNVVGRVRPTTLFDIMAAGLVTNQAWVDVTTYNFFFSHSVSGGAPDTAGDAIKPSDRVAVIQGIFDPSGEKLRVLKPVFRYPWPSQPTVRPRNARSRYLVEVTDDGNNTTRVQFDATNPEDTKEGREVQGFFEVMVPVAANREITSVRILDLEGKREFTVLKRSKPPTIRIVSPKPGDRLGEKTEVSWEATDSDTPPDQLMFQMAFSYDGGRSWVPVGVDIRGKSASFPSSEIPMADNNGVIRVFVSDGLNTAYADVDKLATPAAKYRGYGQYPAVPGPSGKQ